jgi:hypothetical protein
VIRRWRSWGIGGPTLSIRYKAGWEWCWSCFSWGFVSLLKHGAVFGTQSYILTILAGSEAEKDKWKDAMDYRDISRTCPCRFFAGSRTWKTTWALLVVAQQTRDGTGLFLRDILQCIETTGVIVDSGSLCKKNIFSSNFLVITLLGLPVTENISSTSSLLPACAVAVREEELVNRADVQVSICSQDPRSVFANCRNTNTLSILPMSYLVACID